MSTWIYLVCEDHNPPIKAGDESGQHLYDLPQIRADLADRASLIEAYENDELDPSVDYFRRHSAAFLSQHQTCVIAIRDEYGRGHPLTEDGAL